MVNFYSKIKIEKIEKNFSVKLSPNQFALKFSLEFFSFEHFFLQPEMSKMGKGKIEDFFFDKIIRCDG